MFHGQKQNSSLTFLMMQHTGRSLVRKQRQQSMRTNSGTLASSFTSCNRRHGSRPLVVLSGWLGCQLPQLQKYEALWQNLGFDTYPMVASTSAVVDACLHLQGGVRASVTCDFGSHQIPRPPLFHSTVQDWAWHVFQVIEKEQPECFVMHVFSNGGCFVWESMCRIWEQAFKEEALLDDAVKNSLRKQRDLFKGVVLDSCPAWYGTHPEGLWKVLQTCPQQDLKQVIERYGQESLQHLNLEHCLARNQEYFDYLATDLLNAPQLYLYSQDDLFADATHITALIDKQRQTKTQAIHVQQWETSKHCAHLREHPEDYRQAVQAFAKGIMKSHAANPLARL
jgi:hypothetical protein